MITGSTRLRSALVARPVKARAVCIILGLSLTISCVAASTVTWVGAGDGVSWAQAANWSSQFIPTATNDVVIDVPGDALTVRIAGGNVNIRSLQCRESLDLAGGTLTLTAGTSAIEGALTFASRTSLTVSGTNTAFSAAGPVALNGASLYVLSDGDLFLPTVTNYTDNSGCCGSVWEANGAGSVLRLPGLTNFTGNSVVGWDAQVRAKNGARVELPNLADIPGGAVFFYAEASNSVVSLPALVRATSAGRVLLEARSGSTVSAPLLTDGLRVGVTRRSGGVIPTVQFTRLLSAVADGVHLDLSAVTALTSGGGVTLVNGGTADLASLTSADGVTFSSQGGTALSLPLRNYTDTAGCCGTTLEAVGTGSQLVFPALTNLIGNPTGTWDTRVRATAGGRVVLTNCVALPSSYVTVLADGTNSLVDLSNLRQCPASGATIFEARNGGTIFNPQLTDGSHVLVTLRSGGSMPIGQYTALQSITADGMTLTFSNLAQLTSRGSVTVLNGGNLSLPSLVNADGVSFSSQGGTALLLPLLTYADTSGCCGATLEAVGAGSQLVFPFLTDLIGNPTGSWDARVRATSGGQVVLSNCVALPSNYVTVLADGTNSLVDFSNLRQASTNGTTTFEARNGGTILNPQLSDGSRVLVTLRTGGSMPIGQYTTLQSITADGVSLNFTNLAQLTARGAVTLQNGGAVTLAAVTNVDGLSFSVPAGSALVLPVVRTYLDTSGCCGATWTANGLNAVLSLPALTNLAGNPSWATQIRAQAGGFIDLGALRVIPDSQLSFLADATNSRINLSNLVACLGSGRSVSFTVQNGATIDTSSLARLNCGQVTVDSGGLISLNSITNADGSSFYARAGQTIALSNVLAYTDTSGCCGAVWEANGAGAVIALPALTQLAGNPTWAMQARALAGGRLKLGQVEEISDSQLNILADGTNSVVELAGLQRYNGVSRTLGLTVRNSGSIQTPQLATLTHGSVTKQTGGWIDLSQVTTLDGTSLFVSTNEILSLNATSYADTSGCCGAVWQASGPGAVLRLPNLIMLVGNPTWAMQIKALVGGLTDLGNVTQIQDGWLNLLADGTNSVIDLHSLLAFEPVSGGLTAEARLGGTILWNALARLNRATLFLRNPGSFPTAQLQALLNSSVTIDGRSASFAGLSDYRGTTFTYTNGGTAIFPPAADLAITDIAVPSAAAAGQLFQVVWGVTNRVADSGPRHDAIFLSSDSSVGNDLLLGELWITNGLGANSSQYLTNTFILPPGITGNRWVILRADNRYEVFEGADETNNTLVAAQPVIVSAADLVVDQLTAPAAATFGSPITVSWRVRNAGSTDAPVPWVDTLYLSTNTTVSPGAIPLRSFPALTVPLSAGQSYSATQTVALPLRSTLNPGQWFVVARTDAGNVQAEANENNNTRASAALTATLPPLPDLLALTVFAPSNATPGRAMPVSWVTTNQGPAAVSNAWEVAILLTNDATGTAEVLGYFSVPDLLPTGGSLTRTQQVILPTDGPAGALRLGVQVDNAQAIVEADESNNTTWAAAVTQVPAMLSLWLSGTQVPEDAVNPALRGQVTRNGDLGSPVTVGLTSSLPARLSAPATIVIPANTASAAFDLQVVPDGIVTGDTPVQLFANAAGYAPGSNGVTVLERDTPQLGLSLASGLLREGQGTTATLLRDGSLAQSLVVTLANTSPSQIVTPATVTFPKNAATVEFPVLAVDDYYVEAQHSYTLGAAAPGYESTFAMLSVTDSDLPALTLALSTARLSESAGAGDATLTITRAFDGLVPLELTLLNSSPGRLAVARQVTLAPGELSRTIPLSPIRDHLVGTNTSVTLTVQAQETLSLTPIAPGVSTNLLLIEGDGPTLQFALARGWLCAPGASNASFTNLTVQLRRSIATNTAIVAAISAEPPGLLSFPASVGFASNETTAAFTINATSPIQVQQSVTLRALCDGFADAMATLTLAPAALPDLVISNVVAPATGLTDAYFPVNYREQNIGAPFAISSQPQGISNIAQKIFLSPTPSLGSGVLVGSVVFNGTVNPYTFLDRSATFRLPSVPGDYWVIVQADGSNAVAEISEANNLSLSSSPIHVDPAYTATVTASPHTALAGTPIVLSGTARQFGTALPAAYEIVSLHIGLRGTERVIAALTDASGNFSTTFTPLPGEAGLYTVGAAHPGITNHVPVQDTFSLLGICATPASLAVAVPAFQTVTQQVTLANLGDVPLSGLTASIIGAPPQFSVAAAVSPSLAPFGTASLTLQLGANTDTNFTRLFTVRVMSAEGAVADVTVNLTAQSLRPKIVLEPDSLVGGAVRGGQSFLQFSVANLGGAASGPLQVVLPVLPFVSVTTPLPMPPLAPGASNVVTLRLAPAADVNLGEYTGNLQVSDATVSATMPFSFRVLSTNLGALTVEVTDQYTYYAQGAPRVTNALVELRDPATGATLFHLASDTNGLALFTNVLEGYYDLHVTADGHEPYRKLVLVPAGANTRLETLLNRDIVQFIWNVVPTEIGDRTHITIQAVFETVVPLPVVTVEPSVIDLANYPNGGTINLTITNHGLLAAQQTRISFSSFDCWSITPLISEIGTLAARSSIVVPVKICHDLSCSRDFSSCAAGPVSLLAGPQAERDAKVAAVLGKVHKNAAGGGGGNCGGGAVVYIVPCGDGGVGGSAPVGVANAGGDCEWHPVGGGPLGGGGWLGGIAGTAGAPCDPCALALLKAILKCVIEFIPFPDWFDCAKDGYECASGLNDNNLSWGDAYACTKAGLSCAKAAGKQIPWLQYLKYIECGYEILTACPDRIPGLAGTATKSFTLNARKNSGPTFVTMPELYPLSVRLGRMTNVLAYTTYLFGSENWLHGDNPQVWGNWLDAWGANSETNSSGGPYISATERSAMLALPLPTDITAAAANEFLDRWNRSLDYWQAGIFNATNVPAGSSTNFIAINQLKALATAAHQAILDSEAEGYPDLVQGVEAAKAALQAYISQPSEGICAQVRLKLDQEAVIARDVFRATLEILNRSGTPLTGLAVDLVVYNPDGTVATTLFGLSAPALSGLTAVDGSGRVEAATSASAAWNLLPTIDAAPGAPQEYYVGGSIRYTQEGLPVTVPLALVSITVHPLAQLHLSYFHQRDVLGDDPFTDAVEPSVPYSLAVMVRNTGNGTARNLRITSAQPQIVDNEKGLFIDFQIIATEVAGKNLVPSLTADFGNLAPGSIGIAQWLLKSTLQGLFIDYQADFENLDNLGNPRLSLIQSVDIHELIRVVRARGSFEDGLPDLLVNDLPDIDDLPDTLYLSSGSIVPVSVVQTGAVSGVVAPASLQVTLVAPLPAGWSYLRFPDPGNGQFRLSRVLRSDGTALTVGTNVWTTDRTFVGGGRRPVRENRLHLLDYNSTGSYTLIYESLTPPDTTAPTSRVAALPVVSGLQVPILWSGQDNAGGSGIAWYDIWVARDSESFLPWLQKTTLSSALFDGLQGHTYAFYSVATDLAGNRQAVPTVPDAITSVALTNHPPLIGSAGLAIDEGTTLNFACAASDPDAPPQKLSFGLVGSVPPGLSISPQSGVLTWPTSEATGPGTNTVLVRVTDNGFPSLSATGQVTIVVNEVNRAPVLASITNRVAREGRLLTFTNFATDADLPTNSLTFSLGPNAPAGAAVHPSTGLFTWTPSPIQGGVSNVLTLILTDNGVPPLSATQQFSVVVRDTMSDFDVRLGSTTVLAGDSNSVPVVLKSGLEMAHLSFVLEAPYTRLADLRLQRVSPEIAALGLLPLGPDLTGVSFDFDPSSPQTGQRVLADLGFTSVAGTNSAIVPLHVLQLSGQLVGGQLLNRGVATDGRVFIVADQPIMDASALAFGALRLSFHGRPGKSYIIEAAPNLEGTAWQPVWSWIQTNLVQTIDGLPATNSLQFWRGREP